MTMRDLAEITVLATTEPRKAARALLASAPAGAIELLMDAAAWKDRDVEDFERGQLAVLIDGSKFGRYWLASSACKRALVPPAPRMSPRGIVALARATVAELSSGRAN